MAQPPPTEMAESREFETGPGLSIMPVITNHSARTISGLTSNEAAQRLAVEGPNALPGSEPKSTAAIVREVLTQPMFLMLLGAGSIYLVLGDRAEALFLLAFVFVVIGITLVQERRTQRALDALRDLSSPRALVVRDGFEQRIAGRDVVRGDALVLHAGDRVPADARLLGGRLSVDESLLTGESVPVTKLPAQPGSVAAACSPGGEGTPFVFASTVVTQGVGVAEVHATAHATAVGRIGEALSASREQPSALQADSNALVRTLGIGALLLACAQVLLLWFWDARPVLQSLLSGIALAMAILPEEVPVIITVFLALGAWRISRQQVLTRRAYGGGGAGHDHGAGGGQDWDVDAEPHGGGRSRNGGRAIHARRTRRASPRPSTHWSSSRCSRRRPIRLIRWRRRYRTSAIAGWLARSTCTMTARHYWSTRSRPISWR